MGELAEEFPLVRQLKGANEGTEFVDREEEVDAATL